MRRFTFLVLVVAVLGPPALSAAAPAPEFVLPRRATIQETQLIGNCSGPPSPGEHVVLRSRLRYGVNAPHRVTWGLRGMLGGSFAPWLRPVKTTRTVNARPPEGVVQRDDTFLLNDNGPLDGPVNVVTYGRIENRAARTSKPLALALGTTLAVRVINGAGTDLPAAVTVDNGDGCVRTRGRTRSTAGGRRIVFFHVDPTTDAVITAGAPGYTRTAVRLSSAGGDLHGGTVERFTVVLQPVSSSGPQWSSAQLRQPLYSGDTSRPVVYLTFDDGFGNARQVSDVLVANGVRATFCLNGSVIDSDPGLVAYLVNAGQDICNHTYDHADLTTLSSDQIVSELAWTDASVRSHGGPATTPFLRPPYGSINGFTVEVAASQGYRSIMWNVDPRDWACEVDTAGLVDRVVSHVTYGSIILMHTEGCVTPQALPSIISVLRARGYSFETLRQLPSWKGSEPPPDPIPGGAWMESGAGVFGHGQ